MHDKSLRNRLLNTFLNLIKIDEIYTQENEIVHYVLNILNELRIPYKIDSFGNVVGYIAGEGEPIMLNTHLDIPESVPNLDFEIDENVIRGTGKSILGADPKSGLAVLLELARNIKEYKLKTCPIELVFTLGEEAGLLGALNLDYSLITAKMGLVLDEDGPCTNIVIKAPGYYRIDATFTGKIVHPRDWKEGINVLPPLAKVISDFQHGEITNGVTFNIGMLSVGTARNSVAGIAELKAELRSFNTEKLVQQGMFVEEAFTRMGETEGIKVDLDTQLEFKSYELKKNHPLFKRLELTYDQMTLKPHYYETFGGSDANIFNSHGIMTVPVGSAYYLAHQYEEYVNLDDMQELALFLTSFVQYGLENK